jgi:hypothetical protein
MATRGRRRSVNRRVFIRPFLGPDCRRDFEVLQARLLDKFTPPGAVDTSAFEDVMAVLWKRSFTADPRPRVGTGGPLAMSAGAGARYAEPLPEYQDAA